MLLETRCVVLLETRCIVLLETRCVVFLSEKKQTEIELPWKKCARRFMFSYQGNQRRIVIPCRDKIVHRGFLQEGHALHCNS